MKIFSQNMLQSFSQPIVLFNVIYHCRNGFCKQKPKGCFFLSSKTTRPFEPESHQLKIIFAKRMRQIIYYLGKSQESGFQAYLRYCLSGLPYFWQLNSGSMYGQLESQRGYEGSITHLPRNKLQPLTCFFPLVKLVTLLNCTAFACSKDNNKNRT